MLVSKVIIFIFSLTIPIDLEDNAVLVSWRSTGTKHEPYFIYSQLINTRMSVLKLLKLLQSLVYIVMIGHFSLLSNHTRFVVFVVSTASRAIKKTAVF